MEQMVEVEIDPSLPPSLLLAPIPPSAGFFSSGYPLRIDFSCTVIMIINLADRSTLELLNTDLLQRQRKGGGWSIIPTLPPPPLPTNCPARRREDTISQPDQVSNWLDLL